MPEAKSSKKITNIAILSQRGSALQSMRRAAAANGVNAAVTTFCGRRVPDGGCDILAAFDARLPYRHPALPKGCIAVLRSDNMRIRRLIGGADIPCVACGTSCADTVTVSSLSRGKAMMTVQRELPAMDGGVIEPCELPLFFSGCDVHRALITAAVLLICLGDAPEGGITTGCTSSGHAIRQVSR